MKIAYPKTMANKAQTDVDVVHEVVTARGLERQGGASSSEEDAVARKGDEEAGVRIAADRKVRLRRCRTGGLEDDQVDKDGAAVGREGFARSC